VKTANVPTAAKRKPSTHAERGLTLDETRAKIARDRSRLTLATVAKIFESYSGPEGFGTVARKWRF